MPFFINAPAKVNLNLHITGKRDDGYHTLLTRMQKLDLCDLLELEITDAAGIELRCIADGVPADDTNLAAQAAARFLERCGRITDTGVRITLTKNIPVGAGLGGGSSDAGAVLKGINTLLDEPLSYADLLDIGTALGADVPFFVSNHAAVFATGIGDKLEQAASADHYHYLLVNPGFPVNTKWVYDNYRLTKKNNKFILRGSQNIKGQLFAAVQLHNDLERVTLTRYPVLSEIKAALEEAGAAGSLMSGSGPTVFGLFADRETGERARWRLEQKYKTETYKFFSAGALAGA